MGSGKDYAAIHQYTLTTRLEIEADIMHKPFRDIARAKKWLDLPSDYEIDMAAREK